MNNEKWKNLSVKEKSAIITAMAAFCLGWALSVAGFIVPPLGEVADSVLWILGQALIYSASVFSITTYFTSEAKKLRKYTDERLRAIDRKIVEEEKDEEYGEM